MCAQYCISFADVEKAQTNIQDYVHLTPVLTSSILNQVAGRSLFFKCELFQKTGSFKIRGALNAIRGLIPDALEGKPKAVVTHSSGNHGQALTYAAKLEGIPAYIVVPQTAPNCKKLAIQGYGASIVYSEQSDEDNHLTIAQNWRDGQWLKPFPCKPKDPNLDPYTPHIKVLGRNGSELQFWALQGGAWETPKQNKKNAEQSRMIPKAVLGPPQSREKVTKRIMEETEGIMIHPNQEPAVIAGQGTIALEVLNQVPSVDALVVPVGGGGMVAGIAIAIKALKPSVKVYAAEPLNADDCYQSKLKGELTPNLHPPETIADGVKSSIGINTWPIIRDLVDDVFTVTEDEIKYATQLVWERMKLLIEPTAGVGVAAVLSQNFQTVSPEVKNICIVLSGGNVDLCSLNWVKQAERPTPYQSVSV